MPQYESWHMSARDKAMIENILRREIRDAGLTEPEIKEMMSEDALRSRIRAAAQAIRVRRQLKSALPVPVRVA